MHKSCEELFETQVKAEKKNAEMVTKGGLPFCSNASCALTCPHAVSVVLCGKGIRRDKAETNVSTLFCALFCINDLKMFLSKIIPN